MNWTAGARWLISLPLRVGRRRGRVGSDPADMGTAFGLDATTTLEDWTITETDPLESASRSRFDRRVDRRITR